MFTSKRLSTRDVVALARTSARTLSVEDSEKLDDVGPHWNVPIETLSDDVLLEIFDLCLDKDEDIDPWYEWATKYSYDGWYALVHVCQRWRYVVFASPRRLNLRLQCTRRRVREMLDVWPAFPIVIWDFVYLPSDEDNIIASLEHRERVCEIKFERLTKLQSENLVPLMQESFPALTKLQIESNYPFTHGDSVPVLPDSLLGGFAPNLRFLCLTSISFPALPNLLLSATRLVYLYLCDIPSGFISPEMVTALSALTKLEDMRLVFGSSFPLFNSDLEGPAPLPLTRSVLLALKGLELRGDCGYLDDFVARIDVPSIKDLRITFTDRPFPVDLFHLPQFIGRAVTFSSLDYAAIKLGHNEIKVMVAMQTLTPGCRALQLNFLYSSSEGLPTLVRACSSSLLPLSNAQCLNIATPYPESESRPELDMGDAQWVDILLPFSAAKSLSLGSMHIVQPVAFALKQVIEEGRTVVLPAIQNISVSRSLPAGPVREAIERFVAARGLAAFQRPGFSEWWFRAQDANDG